MTVTERALLIAQMKIKKIKFKELSEVFGISAVYVSDILNGRKDGPKATQWINKFDKYVNSRK
ncbi:Cro [Latilactobacillus phage TMW 1.706 P1]|uniref:hypothetical protein n=1 Tax=Latilactobacillus curvatus TaxID=28038 RepID=UPI000704B2CD|nr:hypothetical protein [Latilactobacillus curvatus]WCZ54826.1 Cro [Latilactobacillus phage TMW 1.706 P1]MCT3531278.1 transcriptional regulator [Latilactobacillus curvatus]MDG2988170.1 transcriptional regulator [Latilactobacillus curvatus]QAS49592.1 transcriptional regulator [Latilactobacillus curvatus JCM 1096 = DSM 20019]GED82709.1 hypothetical protein LCU01_16170 [Latilactobacillus curvatus]